MTNLEYTGFFLAEKQIHSWSQRFQKIGKYEVTTTVMCEEVQHSVPPSPGIHHLPSYYSFLFDKSRVYRHSFSPKTNSVLVTRVSEKSEI